MGLPDGITPTEITFWFGSVFVGCGNLSRLLFLKLPKYAGTIRADRQARGLVATETLIRRQLGITGERKH